MLFSFILDFIKMKEAYYEHSNILFCNSVDQDQQLQRNHLADPTSDKDQTIFTVLWCLYHNWNLASNLIKNVTFTENISAKRT